MKELDSDGYRVAVDGGTPLPLAINGSVRITGVTPGEHDVVLSDVMMAGGVNGVQLAREIRCRRPDIRVLLTTGYVESLADVKDGEFGVLLKPYTVEALTDALGLSRRVDGELTR